MQQLRLHSGVIQWQSPSNIAVVKYWGKKGDQLPANPSISLTLSKCYTQTTIKYNSKQVVDDVVNLDFYYNLKENEHFKNKISNYLNNLKEKFHFLKKYNFQIDSKSSFPHSAGIASSASGMSALALGVCTLESNLLHVDFQDHDFYMRASEIARLGSGSASRSVYEGWVAWGKSDFLQASSDNYAIPFVPVHKVFKNFYDAILIVDTSPKKVSSSLGHKFMDNHPYKNGRLEQANNNFNKMLKALTEGDLKTFIKVTEEEALSLHALMMSSDPGYVLMKGKTLTILEKIIKTREQEGIDMCFTLDAGPNIHLLYPYKDRGKVLNFIEHELSGLCENNNWIDDKAGCGPLILQNEQE